MPMEDSTLLAALVAPLPAPLMAGVDGRRRVGGGRAAPWPLGARGEMPYVCGCEVWLVGRSMPVDLWAGGGHVRGRAAGWGMDQHI